MQPTKLILAVSLFVASAAGAKVPRPIVDKAVVSSSASFAGAPPTSSSSSAAAATTSSRSSTTQAPRTTPTTTRTTTAAAPSTSAIPSTSAPATSAPPAMTSVAPVPQTNCQTTVAEAVPDNNLPACPNGCTWPTLDKSPPVAQEWLSLFDMSQIPPAPVNGLDASGDVSNSNGYSLTNDPFCTWTFTGCTRTQTDVMQCPQTNVWGVTYDDGPQPPSPILYNYLASVNQTVTMFIIGSRALEYSNTLLEAFNAGHQIAVHTWSHPYLTSQTSETIIAEIKWTEMIIKAITGKTPRYFRAPHGDLDDRVRYIVAALGYKIIQWNHDTEDWMLSSPDLYHMQPSWVDGNFTTWSQTDKNKPQGMITLEHELSLDSVCEAQKSYVIMRNAGWTPMPVAECLGDPQWYVEGGPTVATGAGNSTASATGGSTASGNSTTNPTGGSLVAASNPRYSVSASLGLGLLGVLVVFGAISY